MTVRSMRSAPPRRDSVGRRAGLTIVGAPSAPAVPAFAAIDVNRASREELLRVPGFGRKAVDRIIDTRRHSAIRSADLARLHIPRNKALPFIVLPDHRPPSTLLDAARLAERFRPKAQQLGFGF